MERDEKLGGNAIKTDSKVLSRIENFWYHYKWPTIVVCFFVIVILVCSLQVCNKEKVDISVAYAGPFHMEGETDFDIKSVLNSVMPEDYDKDGSKNSQLLCYNIYTQEQIEKIEADGKEIIDRSYIANENKNFFNYTTTEGGICFIDPSLYQTLKDSDRLAKIPEVVGYTPDGLIDEYGIAISELGIYEEYAVLRQLPEDTVVCLLRRQLTNKEEAYETEKDMFTAIITYKSDEK